MSLITLFGKDPDATEARIDGLKEDIESLEAERAEARYERDEHRKRAHHKHEALGRVEERLPKVNDRIGTVEDLDQPRVAYKSVDSGVATLLIPEGATVVHPHSDGRPYKRRADKVDVLRIDGRFTMEGITATMEGITATMEGITANRGLSVHSSDAFDKDPLCGASDTATSSIEYRVGETHTPSDACGGHPTIMTETSLNTNLNEECAGGIHFFRDKSDAVEWHYSQN